MRSRTPGERRHPNRRKPEPGLGFVFLGRYSVAFRAWRGRLPEIHVKEQSATTRVGVKPLNFQPLYFATDCGRLYGVHHFPPKGQANEQAILIMPPMGQDYVRCHKTLQKLAVDLARTGFHVLRFDYAGTGDSSDLDDWDLETWKRNGLDALRELSERSEANRLSIVGVRLGASLAVVLDATLDSLVLWDPIISGADYLAELNALNAGLLETTLHSLRANGRSDAVTDELVGHRCTQSMQDALRGFSLAVNLNARPDRILWLESSDELPSETPLSVLEGLGSPERDHHRLDMSCHWSSRAESGKTLMGQPAARVILEFFANAT